MILGGAKFTVLYDRVCSVLNHPGKSGDALYHRLRRRIQRWEEAGYVRLHHNVIDPLSVEPQQKKGLYVDATPNILNLMQEVQNSKRLCTPAFSSSDSEKETKRRFSILPSFFPKRVSHERRVAMARAMHLRYYPLFVRPDPEHLNPELEAWINRQDRLFQEWLVNCENNRIVLEHCGGADGPDHVVLPITTRFNNAGRKVEMLKKFETAIDNSLELFDKAVFLTLTTDPKIWMSPAGSPQERIIKDKDGNQLARFNFKGKGLSLYDANRHESIAWRGWYEAEVHRRKVRIPYLRVIEFQKNGLIHDHILLFGIDWIKDWKQLAYEWGIEREQGFMVHAYVVRNRNGRWEWKDSKNRPQDAKKEENPADYLKKYLKKALFTEEGFWNYWTFNKRFFTMSQSLRYLDEGAEIKAAMKKAVQRWRQEHGPHYQFKGVFHRDDLPDALRRLERPRVRGYEDPLIYNDPAHIPGPLEEEENEREYWRKRRAEESLSFAPATSLLSKSGAADLKGLSLADFM
ncbi:hypothetical protein RJ40_02380 [Methanofollis aquaemaris]|uniref:DUF8148 domain-containing protein n=1 Tax=Methanofollis aquaemaris TaxID=126734 RepID=A0A8A3S486_9EURY|nr:hypothetical protein [Methanofollis aquaemaris]QSZ66424.1 hypothetical protein RJ40_02380 [Methanofollis aquaemaris]